jgi:hypothetical protein
VKCHVRITGAGRRHRGHAAGYRAEDALSSHLCERAKKRGGLVKLESSAAAQWRRKRKHAFWRRKHVNENANKNEWMEKKHFNITGCVKMHGGYLAASR